MAENSFKEWFLDTLENKKSRTEVEILKTKKSNILDSEISDKKILFMSDVNGLGDAIMFRGVIQAFLDNGFKVALITKNYHIEAYLGLNIDKIIFWDNINDIKHKSYTYIIGHHLNAKTYKYALEIKAFKKYIVNSNLELNNIITINSKIKAKNIWEVYYNFLQYFGYEYKLINYTVNINRFKKINISISDYIAIHIGSGSLCKNWGIDNFILLSKELDKLNINYLFIAGPFEEKILKKNKIKNLISNLEFLDLVEVLRNAKIVVCHGTSILHLSVVVDTPTVSINSTYDYNFWHPYKNMIEYKNKHIALTSKSSTNCNKYKRLIDFGLGLNKNGCPILKNEIKVEDIIKNIGELINEN